LTRPWYLDNWAAACAEIGANQQLTPGAASHLLLIGTALRDRLPTIAAVFHDGFIGFRLVATIVHRTALIKDPDAMRAVDTALATLVQAWGPMSLDRTDQAIDTLIAEHDPYALRRTHTKARSRAVDVFLDDATGLATLWATLFATDAAAFDQRLDSLASTVCDRDPRTRDQLRSDAMGAIAHWQDHLTCLCGLDHCDAATTTPSTVVIHVVAHADSTEANADPGEPLATPPGVIIGGPLLPGPVVARAARTAKLVPIVHPGNAPPEPRYTPSRALADFVRARDLTCRFPHCDVPATRCDLDHTIAYPHGPTCASNLKALCRFHHLLKTFWGGPGGWRDRQLPDGDVIWCSPSRQSYTTRPGSRQLFPSLCLPTAPVTITDAPTAHTAGLTMPRRKTTRAHDRRQRIDDERRHNETDIDPAAYDSKPPF
jgi:hypothetical protein